MKRTFRWKEIHLFRAMRWILTLRLRKHRLLSYARRLGLLQKDVAAMAGMEEWLYRDLESGTFHRSFTPELADKLHLDD